MRIRWRRTAPTPPAASPRRPTTKRPLPIRSCSPRCIRRSRRSRATSASRASSLLAARNSACTVFCIRTSTAGEPDVPVKAGAKLQQLVPYALEEHLADDIDDLHFAIGKRAGESSRAPVAVVARALLDEWLAMLHAGGIEPEAIYADSELLPHNPGQAGVLR